jgi:ubiquinone/menaquinone biosynthesis C-methylase UbiE
MFGGTDLAASGPTTWADLGCGDGGFTLALAEVIAPSSIIHAMDRDARALGRIATHHKQVRIRTHHGDFTKQPWSFTDLDGILMANSLHYIEHQAAFIHQCQSQLRPHHRFLIVEYDTHRANPWVPYPLGRAVLAALFKAAGYASIETLGSRPSAYHRARLYAAIAAS